MSVQKLFLKLFLPEVYRFPDEADDGNSEDVVKRGMFGIIDNWGRDEECVLKCEKYYRCMGLNTPWRLQHRCKWPTGCMCGES